MIGNSRYTHTEPAPGAACDKQRRKPNRTIGTLMIVSSKVCGSDIADKAGWYHENLVLA